VQKILARHGRTMAAKSESGAAAGPAVQTKDGPLDAAACVAKRLAAMNLCEQADSVAGFHGVQLGRPGELSLQVSGGDVRHPSRERGLHRAYCLHCLLGERLMNDLAVAEDRVEECTKLRLDVGPGRCVGTRGGNASWVSADAGSKGAGDRSSARRRAFVDASRARTKQIFATRAAVELERQKADVRLREQASLLDNAQDAIVVRDLDQRVLYWNGSAERRYGWTAAEALGRPVGELIYEDSTELDAATAATLARGEWVGELHQRSKSGAPITVDGRWALVRDDDGAPKAILAVNTDLTDRKKLLRTEEQLRQAQKMEAIGRLAGGVAHDFNNLLSVILSYAELILDDLQPSDPLCADLDEVKRAGLRATELTRQLLAFSRKQILQPVVLDLNQVVAGVEKMLGRLLGEHIALSILTHPDPHRRRQERGRRGPARAGPDEPGHQCA